MKMYRSLTELIGHTPLLALTGYCRENGLNATIAAKLEAFNPAGSVKDRTACAMLDYGEEPETDPEISGYLKAYLRFLMDYQPNWEGIETPLYDPGMLFAGTPDRWGHINGRRVLVDIKTGVVHRHAVSAQLAGYELLIGGFAPEETYALRLDKSGVYELIPIRADADLFLWCFNIHRALKRRI